METKQKKSREKKMKNLFEKIDNRSIGKILSPLLLFSPVLAFADGESDVFSTAKNRFQAVTEDPSLILCIVGILVAIAIWAAWKGSLKTFFTCLLCSGLVAKFNSVVTWVINFFQKA